ncbi:Uncharacterized protein Rs2_32582 [Raphanus sativus]|nr:Uncharacterized protein Rs2_32582 [Raphanus sativus]
MVEPAIQYEHEDVRDGDNGDDSTTETQPQIDGTGSESSQTLDTIKALLPTDTNPPPPVSTTPQQKEDVTNGVSTRILQANTAPPPSSQVGPSDDSLQSSIDVPPLTGPHVAPLGAWTKPLAWVGKSFAQFDAPPEPINWPPLSAKSAGKKVYSNEIAAGNTSSNAIPPPTKAIPTDKKRFPWTARLNPKSRNLHRVTIPEYMEDGTPKVTIPNHVLLNGLQNQKEYVVGQFTRCLVPSGGLVHAVLNKIWGKKCNIFVKKISDSSYIFHIPDENTRKWVLERGLWHVDDSLMFVAAWNSNESLSLPEITSIPLWVTLKNIPAQLYSIFALEWIASGLGEPMLSHRPWLDPTMLGEAKVLVEIELDKPFPQKIAAWDKQGNYSMIDVEYTWLPSKCAKCGHLGHKAKRCLSTSQQNTPAKDHEMVVVDVSASPTIVGAPSLHETAISHPSENQDPTMQNNTISNEVAVPATHTTTSQVGLLVKTVANEDEPSRCQVDSFVKSAAVAVDFSPVATDNATVSSFSSPAIDMFSSLASITVLENMCNSPSTICINDTIETQIPEPAQKQSTTTTSQEIYTCTRDGACLVEPDLGSNKFASLINVEEEEEDTLESENETEPMDYLTPSGKRILRERPVKPSTKAREMHLQHTSRGRGSRGRGNRGRCG